MIQADFTQVEAFFAEALARPPEDWESYLASAAEHPEVRRRVRSLLVAHQGAGPFDRLADQLLGVHPAAGSILLAMQLDRLRTALAVRYALERELGHGGMATVYLAQDLKHDRPVAIKVLRSELRAALGAERFLTEIKITARLDHPHILPLLDSGEADGFLYYVMPYVEGESLRDRLKRERQLPIEEACQITREVADALAYAHGHSVIHRDIKPENILLAGGHARVTDFGIARAISTAAGENLTQTGLAIGTPRYMSPEQSSGEHEVDGRSDIYSLGCVLYEMLVGEPPYTGPSAQAIFAKRLSEPLPRVSVVREAVPAPVEQALTRALAKAPVDRFAGAARFAEALSAPEASAVASSLFTGKQLPPTAWLTKRPVMLAATSVLVLATAAIVGLMRRGDDGARHATTDRSVAVLAFRVLSDDTAAGYLSLGLAEDIATTLVRVRSIAVKSPAAVAREQANARDDLAAIGRGLRTRYLLDGSIRPAVDSIRISARLIESATETQVWAATYDRGVAELPRVASDIAQDLATWLAGALQPAEQMALALRPTTNADAYEAYLRGNVKFLLRDREANRSGIVDYRRALTLDPGFHAARARIAMMEAQQGDYAGDSWLPPGTDALALLDTALARADSTVALDPSLADGWTARCYVLWMMNRNPEALEACDRAVETSALDVEVRSRRAAVLFYMGRDSAAAEDWRRCRELDPEWFMVPYSLGRLAMANGQLVEALALFDQALQLNPGYSPGYFHRGRVRLLLDDTKGARADLERQEPGGGRVLLRALVEVREGRADSAQALAAGLAMEWRTSAAMVYTALGEPTRAIRLLESGHIDNIGQRTPDWVDLRWPEFDPLRADPRFQRVVALAKAQATAR